MTRVWDDPDRFADDMVEGFTGAFRRYVTQIADTSGVIRSDGIRPGKVGIVVGGGSGHYPAFCGLVGAGLADGAVIGNVFTSPSTEQAFRVAKAVHAGGGVVFSYGNYAGDVMNFGRAEERLRSEGIDCRTVLVTDDVASAPAAEGQSRRGIAGDFVVFKMLGAAAERGLRLNEVERVGRRSNAMTRTMGVAFAGCTLPGRADPLFTVDPSKMELGLGIHGEPGVRTVARLSPAELAAALVDAVLAERPPEADGRAAVILNGLGATKYEELFVLWKHVAPRLADAGVRLDSPEVGELVTSLDMAGCSLTVSWLDDELEELWRAPADTPAFRRGDTSLLDRPAGAPGVRIEDQEATSTDAVAPPATLRVAAVVRACLMSMREMIEGQADRLGDIDSVAGDGDHGRGMVTGLRAACGAATDSRLGAGTLLRVAGAAWGDKAGGSSGALWGAMLDAVGSRLGDETLPHPRTVARAVRDAADCVQRLGHASVGDKTLLDALVPFAEAMEREVAGGAPLAAAWRTATRAASDAAERTRSLVPRVGRAKPLADKSVGTPDPGAISMALCLAAVADVLDRDEACTSGGGEH